MRVPGPEPCVPIVLPIDYDTFVFTATVTVFPINQAFPLTTDDSNSPISRPTAVDLDAWLDVDGRSSVEKLLEIAFDTDLQASLVGQLRPLLTQFPHLKRGLAPLVRFVNNLRAPSSFIVFLQRDHDALPSLLQILSIESKAVEWLAEDPDSFDWLRLSAGQAVDPEHLKDTLLSEVQYLDDESQVLASLNRFRKRESLRVICAVCLHDMPPPVAAQQFSWIADAGIAAALHAVVADRHDDRRLRSAATTSVKHPINSLCVVGVGALGGQELDLESPLELVMFYDADLFADDPRSPYMMDELHRQVSRAIDWISDPAGLGYRVTMPLNTPENLGVATQSESVTLKLLEYRRWIQSIEINGRTWQRLALMKSRYVAGEPLLANRFLDEFPTIVYSRYLTRADIAGMGALKRKLDRDVKALDLNLSIQSEWTIELLRGWRREIKFLSQFLQWINGGELERLRVANTLQAIDALAQSGCLTEQERSILVTAYNRFYQAIFAAQLRDPFQSTGAKTIGLGKLSASDSEREELLESWNLVKQIRDHLRAEVFADENYASDETDLILDPNPKPEWIDQLLARYGFQRPNAAYRFLMELSREEVSMLSTRRCRHFLSIIAARLLDKISKTPDPDLTLENLAITCRSLGGKGVLWELFSVHEPSLDLYVRLCGASPYLVGILTSNPGMIDELLDSLMLNRLPNEQQMGMMMHELCRGAEDIEPIVHSFKNARHLNVGVRDILGKESIADTHRALADIADVCLQQTVHWQYSRLVKRFGVPSTNDGAECKFSVLALGKLGGREPNYHSDVTLLFMYDLDGTTRPFGAVRHHEPISNEYFFHQLAQKVAQAVNRVGRSGRLYETKNWIISSNHNATLSWSLSEFQRQLTESPELALQRQQLCNARCILGEPIFQRKIELAILQIVQTCPWSETNQAAALAARKQLELSAGERNLKRGEGGTLDVETIVQLLMMRNVGKTPEVFVPGTLEAIERLREHGAIETADADALRDGYNFLRGVESGLRLMNTAARHDLPSSEIELARLAYVLKLPNGNELEQTCDRFRKSNRALYLKYS